MAIRPPLTSVLLRPRVRRSLVYLSGPIKHPATPLDENVASLAGTPHQAHEDKPEPNI